MNITQELFEQLSGAPMQEMSKQLGADESSIQQAVATALPLLLGTMGRNASTPQGADQLHRALERDHMASSPMDIIGGLLGGGGNSGAGGLLGSVLGSVLGGGASQNKAMDAAGILGHVFGGRTERAQRGVAQASGVNSDLAGKVLKYLAPVVMAYLANKMKSGNMSSRELSSVLGSERQQIQEKQSAVGGLMGAVLDRDGDGDVDFMDMVGIGGSILGGMRR